MDRLTQKINEHLERLKYLEGSQEKNLKIINDRIREINEEKLKINHPEQHYSNGLKH